MTDRAATEEPRLFRILVVAFAIQVAGRLLDFWWHTGHEEFESARDQIQAHWVVWLGTILVLGVSGVAVPAAGSSNERWGYWAAIVGNAVYIPIATAHFIQHLNLEEVDWAHIALAIANVVAFVGVLSVIVARISRRKGVVA